MILDYLHMKENNPIVTISLALSATDHLQIIITFNNQTTKVPVQS
jgi:hypothetical protein